MSKWQDEQSQDPSPGETARLVQEALRGDLRAFDRLVERYQRQAAAVSYRLLNDRDDAMEVTQDALLKAWDKLSTLSDPERFGPWLMRIVSNLSLNKRRARALRRTATLDAPAPDEGRRLELEDPAMATPEQEASATELNQKIAAALDELPETQRQALVLFTMAKLPQKEIAKQLGCSVQVVKWHVFSARRKLKDTLKDYL